MSEYVPTTEEVRDNYAWGVSVCGFCAEYRDEDYEKFDRWLDEDRWTIAAAAWDEGYQEANQDLWRDGGREGNPYRAAALGLTAEQEGEPE